MGSEEYRRVFARTDQRIREAGLEEIVLATIPESKKQANDYPTHELACVQYLAEQGFCLKVGPTKERQYDTIMAALGYEMSFAYLLDAFALGTKNPEPVVHYIPTSRGANNGQRILLEDDEHVIKAKLQQGCDEALRYFCKIASVSGKLLGKDVLDDSEIQALYGRILKRETLRLVFRNIIQPYQEVLEHEAT